MKIVLCSSSVPFVKGGYRNIVEWLEKRLKDDGHTVESVWIPFVDSTEKMLQQSAVYRWLDLNTADKIICFRPPAHLIPHTNKILWFIHHIRIFYDLWETPYRGFPDNEENRALRDFIQKSDTEGMKEAKRIFANSKRVAERLKRFNDIECEVLYPPIMHPESYYAEEYNDEIICVCRVEHHKRQHLLIEAMKYTQTPVKLRLVGMGSNPSYVKSLYKTISSKRLKERVFFENQWVSEFDKVQYFSKCLATAYVPYDEDSYGYPTLESCHASKAILTTTDAGAVLELVQDGYNGYVVEPDAKEIAKAMDMFYADRALAMRMGKNGAKRIAELNISWENVLERLLT